MTTFEQARTTAQHILKNSNPNEDLVILDKFIEFNKGWVFFYGTRKYLETGDDRYSLFGNGPIIVGKGNGRIMSSGSGHDIDYYIQQFRQSLADR